MTDPLEAQCVISERDFKRFFQAEADQTPVKTWTNTERRVGVKNRRSRGHERRWQAAIGRRCHVVDRRLPRRLK